MRSPITLHVLGVALVGLVWSAEGSSLSSKEEVTARKMYVNKCAKCHKLYDPANYSQAKWDMWMTKMSKKSKLTPEQQKLLSAYISEQSRAQTAPSSKEPGKTNRPEDRKSVDTAAQ